MKKNDQLLLAFCTAAILFILNWNSYIYGDSSTAPTSYSISSNPAGVDVILGTGELGRRLCMPPESGVRLGGVWIANWNSILRGGSEVKRGTSNNLVIFDLSLNAEKLFSWQGVDFGFEFLQHNGNNTNGTTGSVQNFNSISASPPFDRTELYQAWYRQIFLNEKLTIRIGKTVPNYDFNNVQRAIPYTDMSHNIPSVSGLLYTPIFVNSSMLGVLPGYYDSAFGITATFTPTKNSFISAGAFDGNLARGAHTGLSGPRFNGYYFYIDEIGAFWSMGQQKKPGKFAIGSWYQSGKLTIPGITSQRGTSGFYSYGSQRLWYRCPGINNSGISGFFQYGVNNSRVLSMRQYLGVGLTTFGLTREKDSLGGGAALAWLNRRKYPKKNELMLQGYYQAYLRKSSYAVLALTYIPSPGKTCGSTATWAGTVQSIILF